MSRIFLIFFTLFQINNSYAIMNHCTNTYTENRARSICRGYTLPRGRIRNIKDQDIVCNSQVDHFIRKPEVIGFFDFKDKLNNDRVSAQKFAIEKSKDIKWSGHIPYSSFQTWTWESCDLVTSGMECGYETKTRDVSYTDSEGNRQSRTETYEEPKTCWADISHYEKVHCSNEIMTFNAEYMRPETEGKDAWNPSNEDYYDVLPNKYDLLPGEFELVQIYNNGSTSSRLSPFVKIGSNNGTDKSWNEYKESVTGSGSGARCKQDSNYHINISINTIRRNVKSKSPNALMPPVDHQSQKLRALHWMTDRGTDGEIVDNAYPKMIALIDSSAAMSDLMAEQSRKISQREKLKHKEKLGETQNATTLEEAKKKGYFKNTIVRVALKKSNWWWIFGDELFTPPMYTEDLQSVKPSMLSWSDDEVIATSEMWAIDLIKNSTGEGVYRGFKTVERHLIPNRKYYFEVSMYQKGVPFYLQSCEDAKLNNKNQGWRCAPILSSLFKYRDHEYFSKPFIISFRSPENIDKRGFFQKIYERTDLTEIIMSSLGNLFDSEDNNSENSYE